MVLIILPFHEYIIIDRVSTAGRYNIIASVRLYSRFHSDV